MIKNLGQVAGIYIGNVAPSNTTIIWCNPTILPYSFKVWGGTSWVDLATQEWVKITIGGYLISLPAKTIANDNDYLIINDGTNDNKIKVVDFVRSAVGNPLDFKGVIRVAADFPAPATLEGGDMYIIITSPSGGTVTDPYSGKTFEDTEKIVWDSVTNSWESLGLVKIEVNLGVDTKEDSVIITNTAGSSATIPTASASKAGVMSSQLLRWLTNLINGTTVLAAPDLSNPNIPAHKHNYSDLVNYPAIYQTLGQSTEGVMSQKAVTDTFSKYLPLTGGSSSKMSGPIYFRNTNFIYDSDGNSIVVTDTNSESVSDHISAFGALTGKTYLRTRAGVNLIHQVPGSMYTIYDSNNLPNPATEDDLNNYLPLSAGSNKKLTGELYFSQTNMLRASDNNIILYSEAVTDAGPGRTVIGNYSNRFNILTVGTDVLHNRANNDNPGAGTPYKMWDAYNLPNPAKISDLAAYLLLSGGIMTGGVTFNNNLGLSWKNTAGSVLQQAYFNNNNVFVIGNTSNSQLVLRTGNTDVLRDRNGDSYKVWDSYNLPNPAKISDLAAYLLLSGGIMTGGVTFNNNLGLSWKNTAGSVLQQAYFNNNNVFVIGNTSNSQLVLRTGNTDVLRDRNGDSYKVWDSYNLPNPAGSTDLDGYLPLTAGATKPLTGQLFANQGVNLPFNVALRATNEAGDIKAVVYSMPNNRLVLSDASYDTVISSRQSDLIHSRTGTAYKIWDAYNLSNPALQNGTYSGLTAGKVQGTITFTNGSTILGTYNGSTDLTVNVGGGQPSGDYLPLTAGPSAPLTGKLYINAGARLLNNKALYGLTSEGNEYPLIHMSSNNTIKVGSIHSPIEITSEVSDVLHNRAGTAYKIWDAYNLSSPVTGSGGVAGQLAKWSAGTTLSGGIAYASANTAAALVARDGNGAFAASTVTVTNANITNLNPGGENCVVQSGLIPRATSTCFLGSASRIFQNIYGNNIYAGVALLPVTTATVNIGTADLTYKSGYIQTIHTGGVLPLTTASSVGSSAKPFSSMFATTFNGSATKWNGLSQQVVSSLPSTLTPNTMYFVTA